MLTNIDSLQPIQTIRWHLMPNPRTAGTTYTLGAARCVFQHRPPCVSNDDMVAISWAMQVYRGKDLVLTLSLEQEDLRSMSELSGVPLRDLQEEYGTRGYLGPVRTKLFTCEVYEDLGPYEGSLKEEDACRFLLDTVADTLDIVDDPIQEETK